MDNISKTFALVLILLMAVSSLLMAKPAFGQMPTSTPTPSHGLHNVTFVESGLPLGTLTPWGAILNTQPVSQQVSTSSFITFTNISAGNYSWSIPNTDALGLYYFGSQTWYAASPNSGTINISSHSSQYLQRVTFSPISTPPPSGTNVSGVISSDTTWTKAASPYTLVGNVAVNTGVTLTIQSGVTVNFQLNDLQINGSLNAKGIDNNNIIFLTNETSDTGSGSISSYSSKCLIENTLVYSISMTNYGSLTVNNDTINDVGLTLQDGSADISNSNLANTRITQQDGSSIISNNLIVSGGIGVLGGLTIIANNIININDSDESFEAIVVELNSKAIISDNVIANCNQGQGIWVAAGSSNVQIVRNLIENNSIGAQFSGSALVEMKDNTVVNNSIGIISPFSSFTTINHNNIVNNGVNMQAGSSSFNAQNNWWGTTNTQAINQTIDDSKNDSTLGTITFVPFLSVPNSKALPNPNAPIPSFSQTLLPIEWVAVLGVIVAVIAILSLLLYRRHRTCP